MLLPDKLNILGKVYTVTYKDFEKALPSSMHSGGCNTKTQQIEVDTAFHKDSQSDTLLHEIIHALSNELKIDLSEIQVHILSTSLYQVLNDNGFLKDIKKE